MTDIYRAEPDLDFIRELGKQGGDTLKKCFQCATCSVACPISPDNKPFPRKEMIAASWGLKDKLVSDMDIWLCHHCGDCTTKCPRGAKPGETMAAIRAYAIKEYAKPKFVAEAVSDPRKLPVLIAIPAVILAVLAFITVQFGPLFERLLGDIWTHGVPKEIIAQSQFISTWFVDLVFVPASIWAAAVFALALNRFLRDMHASAVAEGKTDKKDFALKDLMDIAFVQAVIRAALTILKHNKFNECTENRERSTAHMMVLYSFIGLAVVTGIFFVVLYFFHIPGPYSQLNPVKWLANIAGVMLVIGGFLMLKNRLNSTDQSSTFKDWFIIGIVIALGVTGMLTEMSRLAGSRWMTYFTYYLHLIAVFCLFVYLPFSKMAHIVYRTVAMGYAEFIKR